jgi:hypothetical protein
MDQANRSFDAEPPKLPRLSAMLAISALLGMGGGYAFGGPYRDKSEPEERPCLYCGKMKRHNNSFCSAKCCREYRQSSRFAKSADKPSHP